MIRMKIRKIKLVFKALLDIGRNRVNVSGFNSWECNTKKQLMKHINKSIGSKWKNITKMEIQPDSIIIYRADMHRWKK